MKKALFFMLLLLIAKFGNGQFIPNKDDFQYIGRWVQWKNGFGGPGNHVPPPSNGSGGISPADIYGFYSTPFNLPFVYLNRWSGQSYNGANYLSDIMAAAQVWHDLSANINPVISEGQMTGTVNDNLSSGDLTNVIVLDGGQLGNQYIVDGDRRLGVCRITKVFSSCPYIAGGQQYNLGPVLIDMDIILSLEKPIFTGTGPGNKGELSFRYTAIHEIGHAMGLDHHAAVSPTDVMYGSQEASLFRMPTGRDMGALIRLYNYDGYGYPGSINPLQSSIDCEDFTSTSGVLELYDMVGSNYKFFGGFQGSDPPDNCNNCFRDSDEDGIDCGSSSGCGPCGELCTGDMYDISYTGEDGFANVPNYSVAKNTVFIEANEGSLAFEKNSFRFFKAGESITINSFPNQEFDSGEESHMTFEIGGCECPEICVQVNSCMQAEPECYRPFQMFSYGVSRYDLKIYDMDLQVIHEAHSVPVTSSRTLLWGGARHTQGYPYKLTLYNDCSGEIKVIDNDKSFEALSNYACGQAECYNNDVWLWPSAVGKKSAVISTGGGVENESSMSLVVYPTVLKAGSSVSLESKYGRIARIELFDSYGKLLSFEENINKNKCNYEIAGDLSSGSYLLRVHHGNQVSSEVSSEVLILE